MIPNRSVILSILTAGALFCPSLLRSQSESKYVGQILTQRVFYSGPKLHYNEQGRLLEPASVCSWTECAKIRITEVRTDVTTLRITGERQFLSLSDPAAKEGTDVFSNPKWHFVSKKIEDELRAKRAVEIDVDRSASWDADAIDGAMRAIFLTPAENLVDFVPEYWAPFFCKQHVPSSRCADDPLIFSTAKVGHGVAAPRAVFTPDPTYDEAARLAGYQGTTVLWLIITPDGQASDFKIARALGLGLDETAVAAVSTWKFQPATRDGQPVAVQINVEVNFRLY